MSSPKSILSRKNLTELKQLSKVLGIPGYQKYRSANKDELVDKILKIVEEEVEKRKSSPPPSPRTPSINMPRSLDQCNKVKSRGGFNIDELRDIAKEIGIDSKGKNKKELCDEIMKTKPEIEGKIIREKSRLSPSLSPKRSRARSLVPTRMPSSLSNCNDPPGKGGFNINELRKLARSHGINPLDMPKRKLCEKLMEKLEKCETAPLVPEVREERIPELPELLKGDMVEPPVVREPKSRVSPKRVPSDLKNCMAGKAAKGFDVSDIRDIAEHYGINTKGLKKKEICEQLMCKLGGAKVSKEAKEDIFEVRREAPREEVSSDEEMCFGDMSRKKLEKKSVRDLAKDMEKAGIKRNKPTKKDDILEYLCAMSRDGCDLKKDCKEGYKCDISNFDSHGHGLCVQSDMIERRLDSTKGLASLKVGDRLYYGNRSTLDEFKKRYDEFSVKRREPLDIFAAKTIPRKPVAEKEMEEAEWLDLLRREKEEREMLLRKQQEVEREKQPEAFKRRVRPDEKRIEVPVIVSEPPEREEIRMPRMDEKLRQEIDEMLRQEEEREKMESMLKGELEKKDKLVEKEQQLELTRKTLAAESQERRELYKEMDAERQQYTKALQEQIMLLEEQKAKSSAKLAMMQRAAITAEEKKRQKIMEEMDTEREQNLQQLNQEFKKAQELRMQLEALQRETQMKEEQRLREIEKQLRQEREKIQAQQEEKRAERARPSPPSPPPPPPQPQKEVSREELDEVLREIKTSTTDISHLSDMQKKVLACLGLTA